MPACLTCGADPCRCSRRKRLQEASDLIFELPFSQTLARAKSQRDAAWDEYEALSSLVQKLESAGSRPPFTDKERSAADALLGAIDYLRANHEDAGREVHEYLGNLMLDGLMDCEWVDFRKKLDGAMELASHPVTEEVEG